MSIKVTYLILIAEILFFISDAYSELLTVTNKEIVYCGPKFYDLRDTKQIDYFILDQNSNDYLEDCLIKRRSIEQSVTLLQIDELYNKTDYDMLRSTVYPDIIIFISNLSWEIFRKPIKRVQNSPNNILIYLFVMTRNASFTCNNGVFDNEIFKSIEVYMNVFWHKYEMYFLITVFPYTCPGYYVIFKGKRATELRLYDRTITSIPDVSAKEIKKSLVKDRKSLTIGYPLRANIFERFSTAITECSNMHYYWKPKLKSLKKGWCGMDVLVMHDMFEYFQFKFEFPDVDNEEGYGYLNSTTGVATGSLGYLLHDVIDISWNARFIVRYIAGDEIQFLHHVGTDAVCVVVKNPTEVPLWYYPFDLFEWPVWFYLIWLFGGAGLVARFLFNLRGKILGYGEPHSYSLVLSFIALSFTGSYLNKRISACFLRGICILISIPMLALYQGNVNFMYTNRIKFPKYQTIAQLRYNHVRIYTTPSILEALGKLEDSNQIVQQFVNRSELLKNPKIGILYRKNDMELEIIKNFVDENGRPLMYIVKECFSNYYLSYVARKDFPFALDIKKHLMFVLEAGLPEAYSRWTKNALHLTTPPSSRKSKDTELRPTYPSTLEEHRVAFGLLIVGHIVCSIVFLFERWWTKNTTLQVI